jgi:hypothetical protein
VRFAESKCEGVRKRGGVAGLWRGWSAVLWPRAESVCGAASYARTYFRCTVQGETALIRAANNDEMAQLKQLIDAKANVDAKDVIYSSCACVHFQSALNFPRLI